MHTTALLNTLWEFTRGVDEDKDTFIQKALKIWKAFKVRPLKRSKLDVPAKKKTYNLFCKDMWEIKEELKGVTVSKANAIILKEWKKAKASNKNMKNYRDFNEVEKQRYEEALQRYQESRWTKWRLSTYAKGARRQVKRQKQKEV